MKHYLIVPALFILSFGTAFSQPGKQPTQKAPDQSEIDKMMEEAMKGMTEEEKAEMRKMMKNMAPSGTGQTGKTAYYPEFTSNKQLVPKKDPARINSIAKKPLSQAEVGPYAGNLFNKIMGKGNAAEMAIVKKVIGQTPDAIAIGNAAILSMMQGHPQAALALSIKAVQVDPSNANLQNNMASLLTQYGYPEQAIPLLQKLKNQFPVNSTVFNNLGIAWLGLGETDSARKYAGMAARLNPYHPEAKLCGGLMEEMKGDPVKAIDNYIESMENSLNPLTEKLIKNSKGQGKLEKIDFEKIKRSIAIYEYFPRDWMPEIPLLSSNISGYSSDYATKKGFDEMSTRLTEKIELMTSDLSKEVEDLAEAGQDEFVKKMAEDIQKGLSFMSKPAVSVLVVLLNYLKTWMLDYANEVLELVKLTNEYKLEFQNRTRNLSQEQCKIHDNAANEYMQAVNPMVKKFYTEKAEEYRQWTNAYITWSWYVAGNPKNVILIQDLGFVAMLESFYSLAVESQVTIDGTCNPQRTTDARFIAEPEIPNFTCPAVVSIPAGTEWQQLNAAANSLDNNDYTIKNDPGNPIPNITIAYGTDHTSISEPGPEPFSKTAEGSISPTIADPAYSTAANVERTLTDYQANRSAGFKPDLSSPEKAAESVTDDVVKVTGETRQRESEEQKSTNWLREYLKSKIEHQKAMEAMDQKSLDWFREYIKSKVEQQKVLEAREQAQSEWFREYMKSKIEKHKAQEAQDRRTNEWLKEYLKSKIERQKAADYQAAIDKAINDKIKQAQRSKKAHELLKKMLTADCKNVRNTKDIQKELFEKGMIEAGANIEELRSNGLQLSISSGIQMPGTFTTVKGLFN